MIDAYMKKELEILTTKLYEAAQTVQDVIRESEQFKNLKMMYEAVQKDQDARNMFEHFRQIQIRLQEKQMNGEELTHDDIEQATKSVALVQQHELIGKLMEAEQQMMAIFNEFNQIIMKPLEELYGTIK